MSKTAAEWVKEGLELAQAGKKAEALSAYDSAIAMSPTYGEAYFRKAFALDDKKNPSVAIELYNKAIDNGYKTWTAYYNLGIVYNSMGRREEAIEAYSKPLALNQNADCFENKGNALMALGRIDEAIEAFLESLRVNPKNWTVHPRLGGMYDHKGMTDEAIKYFDLCIAANPKDYRSNLRKGEALAKLGRHREALECFKVIDTNPKVPISTLNYSLGASYMALGMKEKAMEHFSRAPKMQPLDALGYVQRGRCYYMIDMKKGAMDDFRKAKELLETDKIIMLLPGYIELIKKVLKSMLDVEDDSNKAYEVIKRLERTKTTPGMQKLIDNIKKLQNEKDAAQEKVIEKMDNMKLGQENKELSELDRVKQEFDRQLAAINREMEGVKIHAQSLEKKIESLKNQMDVMNEELKNKMDDFDKMLTSELNKQNLSEDEKMKLKAYFTAFTGTFGAAFVTAQVIDSDQVQISSDSSTASVLSSLVSFIPVIGDTLSSGVKSLGDFMQSKEMKTNARKMKRMAGDGTKLSQLVREKLLPNLNKQRKATTSDADDRESA